MTSSRVMNLSHSLSSSSGYELMHEPDFPVLRIGNRMVVPKEHTGGGT